MSHVFLDKENVCNLRDTRLYNWWGGEKITLVPFQFLLFHDEMWFLFLLFGYMQNMEK